MDEELKQRISGYLDALEASANSASQFVASEAPAVAQEYLAWYFTSSLLGVMYSLAAILAVVSIAKVVCSHAPKEEPAIKWFAWGLACLLCVFPSGFLGENIHSITKVKVAPRVVLMEKVAELAK